MQASSSRAYDPDETLPPFDPPEPVRRTATLTTRGPERLNQYIRRDQIGNGKNGEVFLCEDESADGYQLVVKIMKRVTQRDKIKLLRRNYQREAEDGRAPLNSTMSNIRKEIATMARCRHPNIARLVEVIDDPRQDKVYLFMEYLPGGPVFWNNEDNKPILLLRQTRRIIRDTVLGLEYLHHEGIIHRDIKPANLCYTRDREHVKIIDFGVAHYDPLLAAPSKAKNIGKSKEETNPDEIDPSFFPKSDLRKVAGTPAFIPPEVVWHEEQNLALQISVSYDGVPNSVDVTTRGPVTTPIAREKPPITTAVDVWSLGVTLYCLLFGHTPFNPDTFSEYTLFNIICSQDWEPDEFMATDELQTGGRFPAPSDSESYIVMRLLDRMLQKHPSQRISLADIKGNPWIMRDIENPREWTRMTAPGEPYKTNWVKSAGMKIMKLIPKKG